MNTTAHAVAPGPVVVRRVGDAMWILRVLESLEDGTVSALHNAFRDAIERDATDVVVDLGTVSTVSAEGATTLATMVDFTQSRNGALWIAAAWPDGTGYTLRPIHEPAPAGLIGVSAALDRGWRGRSTAILR